MTSAETATEVLQYSNTVISCTFSIFIHGYIIRRIRLNATSLNNYLNFLVLQSVVYIFGSALRLILNERTTLKFEERTGYFFIVMPSWFASVMIPTCLFVEVAESMLLTLFNIHRVLIFLRPRKVGWFYILGLPTAFFGTVLVGVSTTFFQDISYYASCTYYVVTLTIVLICYFILRRHFRLNNYSNAIRKAQNKMSKGLLIQIFVQTIALAIMGIGQLIFFMASLFHFSDNTATDILGIYMLVVYVVFLWFSVLIGFIIKWSISGLLTIKPSHRNSRVSNEVTIVKGKGNVKT
ncbi:hypothetical protein V3C99_002140 [Haemonchus contortus]